MASKIFINFSYNGTSLLMNIITKKQKSKTFKYRAYTHPWKKINIFNSKKCV